MIASLCVVFAAGMARADEPKTDKDKPADKVPPAEKSPPAEKAPPAADASSASAEVKAGTGVDKHEIVGEATTFPKETTVWVWSRVLNSEGTVKHVWKKDGAEIWSASLPVSSKRWSTQTRRLMRAAGSYEVEVLAADGTSLGKVAFTIE